MPEKFNLEVMEKRILEKLHPPTRTGNLIERLREATRRRKPRLPRL